MTKRLQLLFRTANSRTVTLSLADPKDDLTAAQAQAAMNTLISKNIFTTTSGDLVAAAGVRVVSTETVTLFEA